MLSTVELSLLKDLAGSAAVSAGEYIQSQFDADFIKQSKEGGDSLASQVVTEVDFKAQEIILNQLQEATSRFDFGLLTEEAVDNRSRLHKSYFWCIDPLDGTLAYAEHRTGYAVSIALVSREGDPVVGVVYVPDSKKCYAAYLGSGVEQNNQTSTRSSAVDQTLHCFMDRSFLSEAYYPWIQLQLEQLVSRSIYSDIKVHSDFGGVRNALGVMASGVGCYFKFPKSSRGCGSIWDYAATRLLMEEHGLLVSNARGGRLHLNDPATTFMNHQGVIYATDPFLVDSLIRLGVQVASTS